MKKYLLVWIFISGILCSCVSTYKETSTSVFYKPGQDSIVVADAQTESVIYPYREKLESTMNEVLAYSKVSMDKGQPESALGNFVADACFSVAKKYAAASGTPNPDFCVLNNGGLRSSLPAGKITRGNIFELMPFENELVVVSLPGSSVMELFRYISDKGGVPVSSLKMQLETDHLADATIGNEKFDSLKTYRVLTSDYLANGGDDMTLFAKNKSIDYIHAKVRDAIIEYLQDLHTKNDTLISLTDGRLSK